MGNTKLSDKRENYPTKFMKSTKIIFFAALLCVVDSFAVSITPTSPLYSTGGFIDPSDDPLHPTDRSHPWGGGQDLSGARTLAESFSLQFDSVLSSVELWSYDTVDGSTGTLQEIQYALHERLRLYAELNDWSETIEPADRPKFMPKPRSEIIRST